MKTREPINDKEDEHDESYNQLINEYLSPLKQRYKNYRLTDNLKFKKVQPVVSAVNSIEPVNIDRATNLSSVNYPLKENEYTVNKRLPKEQLKQGNIFPSGGLLSKPERIPLLNVEDIRSEDSRSNQSVRSVLSENQRPDQSQGQGLQLKPRTQTPPPRPLQQRPLQQRQGQDRAKTPPLPQRMAMNAQQPKQQQQAQQQVQQLQQQKIIDQSQGQGLGLGLGQQRPPERQRPMQQRPMQQGQGLRQDQRRDQGERQRQGQGQGLRQDQRQGLVGRIHNTRWWHNEPTGYNRPMIQPLSHGINQNIGRLQQAQQVRQAQQQAAQQQAQQNQNQLAEIQKQRDEAKVRAFQRSQQQQQAQQQQLQPWVTQAFKMASDRGIKLQPKHAEYLSNQKVPLTAQQLNDLFSKGFWHATNNPAQHFRIYDW